ESPRVKDLIWTGSDDGLVHVTLDGGRTWANVTPPDLPKWTMINSIEPDPHTNGGCYLACTGYKQGDNKPYLFKTKNYGISWTKITEGIEDEDFTRVIRADPKREGLLYAGTEQGMYLSFTDGQHWQKFQQNLPIVPITDLTIKNDHLIAATQGRSFWIIDDLTPLHQIAASPDFLTKGDLSQKDLHLFQPADSHRMRGGASKGSKTTGENHPNGTVVHFYLKNKPGEKDTVTLAILEQDGDTIKLFSNQKLPTAWENKGGKLSDLKAGGNSFVWNHRYPNAERFEGMILWSYNLEGPKAVPANYRVRVSAAGKMEAQAFRILPDPRSEATPQVFEEQFGFVQSVSAKITEAHRCIQEIRNVRGQLKSITGGLPKSEQYKPIKDLAAAMDSTMTSVEEAIYQTKNRSSQDPLNYPVRLNDKLANLMGQVVEGDFAPTQQAKEVGELLFRLTDEQLSRWKTLKEKDLPELNRLVRESGVDLIRIK
ncbi:MAG: glycosyl hydrolase, partial [Saprospiraceae bacterium]|nr:glycosyl hydrolase [Saprospiraceae bacterium]